MPPASCMSSHLQWRWRRGFLWPIRKTLGQSAAPYLLLLMNERLWDFGVFGFPFWCSFGVSTNMAPKVSWVVLLLWRSSSTKDSLQEEATNHDVHVTLDTTMDIIVTIESTVSKHDAPALSRRHLRKHARSKWTRTRNSRSVQHERKSINEDGKTMRPTTWRRKYAQDQQQLAQHQSSVENPDEKGCLGWNNKEIEALTTSNSKDVKDIESIQRNPTQ